MYMNIYVPKISNMEECLEYVAARMFRIVVLTTYYTAQQQNFQSPSKIT